jgi:hypothetical protein
VFSALNLYRDNSRKDFEYSSGRLILSYGTLALIPRSQIKLDEQTKQVFMQVEYFVLTSTPGSSRHLNQLGRSPSVSWLTRMSLSITTNQAQAADDLAGRPAPTSTPPRLRLNLERSFNSYTIFMKYEGQIHAHKENHPKLDI